MLDLDIVDAHHHLHDLTRSYPWLRVPVLDTRGEIVQRRGVTPESGLYVLGQRFQHRRGGLRLIGSVHLKTVRYSRSPVDRRTINHTRPPDRAGGQVSLSSPHAALVIDQLVKYPTVRG